MQPFRVTRTIAGKDIVISSGELAKQANGSVLIQVGGTVVFVSACMAAQPREEADFFPLIVDYQEKTYAAGRIPGGFFKREGKPKDIEILTARLIDRSIRPFFPDSLRNDVQVVCMVLSSDGENDPDIYALNGASLSLFISDIPFENPLGACRICRVDGNFLVNPTYQDRAKASLDMIVSGNEDKILMIEAKANRESEDVVLQAIQNAHKHIKEFIALQRHIQSEIGKNKKQLLTAEHDKAFEEEVTKIVHERLSSLYFYSTKEDSALRRDAVVQLIEEKLTDKTKIKQALALFAKLEEDYIREKILKTKVRPDGRAVEQIRPIECTVGILPRAHGSAVFTRGQTQSLAATTLGTSDDMQMIEALEGQTHKRFMLHYNFPPFSVGEVSPLRGSSRREIGHGALAEKALEWVIPSKDVFPYTIRVVSEILESNGSSSMATVCASTLSLMDAGVPISEPVAGIAMGLVSSGNEYIILTDIAGVEDHMGDMDFKVAGTRKGITAIQLDLKIKGIGIELLREALQRAKDARLQILGCIDKAISVPRKEVSKFAPKIVTIKIQQDKIGELIGPGGRTIKKIIKDTGASIDIDDEAGEVMISSADSEAMKKAVSFVTDIIKDLEVGDYYDVTVRKITSFGAFCETASGKSGLLHVSEISNEFVKNVSDYLREGDVVRIKVVAIDDQGRVTFSKKQVDERQDH